MHHIGLRPLILVPLYHSIQTTFFSGPVSPKYEAHFLGGKLVLIGYAWKQDKPYQEPGVLTNITVLRLVGESGAGFLTIKCQRLRLAFDQPNRKHYEDINEIIICVCTFHGWLNKPGTKLSEWGDLEIIHFCVFMDHDDSADHTLFGNSDHVPSYSGPRSV